MISPLSGLLTSLALDQGLFTSESFETPFCSFDEFVDLWLNLISKICFVSTHGDFVYEEEDLL